MTANRKGWGWGYPLLGRKWHWFEEGLSLCGRWVFTGELRWLFTGELDDDDSFKSRKDCKPCRRKLNARKEAAS